MWNFFIGLTQYVNTHENTIFRLDKSIHSQSGTNLKVIFYELIALQQ